MCLFLDEARGFGFSWQKSVEARDAEKYEYFLQEQHLLLRLKCARSQAVLAICPLEYVSSTFLTVTDMHQAVTIQGYMLCEPQANTTDHNMLDKLSAKNSLLIIREVKYC